MRVFSATRLDWFEATVDGEFDLVLMADVAYDGRHFEPLLRHLQCCLVPLRLSLCRRLCRRLPLSL